MGFELVFPPCLWEFPPILEVIPGPRPAFEVPRPHAKPIAERKRRMLFSPKIKGFFIEKNEHTWMLARTSALTPPFTVEALFEVPLNDAEALKTVLTQLQPKKGQSGYLNASCAVYPPKRFMRRASLDLKRVKEPNYLQELCALQFRIEPEKYTTAVLNSADGSIVDINKNIPKEVFFCGILSEEIIAIQDFLLESGIYPSRLELGSVGTLGSLVNYLATLGPKTTTLVLEIGPDSTNSFIIGPDGVEASRPIVYGIESMIPVVQKKLSLKDEESAKKLFYSNTFDFTSMGPELVQRLLKELQSSIGFFEVQTGQSVTQLICSSLPSKLSWIESTISNSLGVSCLKLDLSTWLKNHEITLSEQASAQAPDVRWVGLFSLMLNKTQEVADATVAEKKA